MKSEVGRDAKTRSFMYVAVTRTSNVQSHSSTITFHRPPSSGRIPLHFNFRFPNSDIGMSSISDSAIFPEDTCLTEPVNIAGPVRNEVALPSQRIARPRDSVDSVSLSLPNYSFASTVLFAYLPKYT
jgi:hypothetical protein